MTDIRCNCGMPYCSICKGNDPYLNNRGLGSAQPWTPKPGEPLARISDISSNEEIEEAMRLHRRWERWQTIRRYLLVLLLALLGGMIGGMTSALTLLYYFN